MSRPTLPGNTFVIPCRWSEDRKKIMGMKVDDTIFFPRDSYQNVGCKVRRLNSSYRGIKVWSVMKPRATGETKVTRLV